ncbi:MAG: hypothetical protein V1726_01160 [Methanobacteriota archaeon]
MKNIRIYLGILVFGSLWGFSECIIGSFLRDVGLPAGAIMTAVFAVGLMSLSRVLYQQRGMQMGMGMVAGMLRLCNPFGGCFLCSAIAIMAEGAIFEVFWYKLSLDRKVFTGFTLPSSLGVITAYGVYVGGYIVTQIMTPFVSSAGFYLENLVVFLPQIFASGLLAAVLGGVVVPVVFLSRSMHIVVPERVRYPVSLGVSVFCWVAVIVNTVYLLWL